MNQLATVQGIYEAFSRGDVAWILDQLAPDVVWEYPVTNSAVPWLQPRRGRDEVAGFFAALGEMQLTKLAPRDFLEGNRVVVVLLDIEFTVRKTGKRITEKDEAHVWRFNESGLISSFRHGCDSYNQHLACQPSP